jgi:mono/diheme cytochrome c family protein
VERGNRIPGDQLNYYRLKAGRLKTSGGLNRRLKDEAPERRWFLPPSAPGGLKEFTDNKRHTKQRHIAMVTLTLVWFNASIQLDWYRRNQMVKILKIFGLVLGSLMGFIIIAVLALVGIGRARFYKTYEVDVAPLEIPTDQAALTQGKHLVEAVTHCGYCHGDNLAGEYLVNDPGAEGIVVAPNLTSGEGGLGEFYTADDWIRAIRHGITSEGRSVIAMPSLFFNVLGQEDLAAMIAYLQTIPPVDNQLPETAPGPMFYALIGAGPLTEAMSAPQIDHNASFPTPPAKGESAEYGAYLVELGQCRACHGAELAGGQVSRSAPIGPNLTPGGELGFWEEETFFSVIRTGTHPSGRELDPYMPWKFFANMTDAELRAIRAYLLSLPKLDNVLP